MLSIVLVSFEPLNLIEMQSNSDSLPGEVNTKEGKVESWGHTGCLWLSGQEQMYPPPSAVPSACLTHPVFESLPHRLCAWVKGTRFRLLFCLCLWLNSRLGMGLLCAPGCTDEAHDVSVGHQHSRTLWATLSTQCRADPEGPLASVNSPCLGWQRILLSSERF